jgi:hypothetical protein
MRGRRSALNAPGRGLYTLPRSSGLFLWRFELNRFAAGVRKYMREGSGHLPVGEKVDR